MKEIQQGKQALILACSGVIASLSCGITQGKPEARQEGTNPLSVMEGKRLHHALHMIEHMVTGSLFISQEAEYCSYSISPTSGSFDVEGGTQHVSIDASSSDCNWWAESNSLDWVSVSPTNGTGDDSVTVTVEKNTESSTRNGTVTIANKEFNIEQQASDDSNGGGGGGGCTMNPNGFFDLSWILLSIIPVFMIVRRRL